MPPGEDFPGQASDQVQSALYLVYPSDQPVLILNQDAHSYQMPSGGSQASLFPVDVKQKRIEKAEQIRRPLGSGKDPDLNKVDPSKATYPLRPRCIRLTISKDFVYRIRRSSDLAA